MENELIEKRLPFSMPAEQSLLGAVLIDPASLNEIAALMKGEDFYLEEHKQIYLAMQELFLANREIDVVTLIDMLVTRGVYDKAGGEDYIRTLSEAVPDALNIKDYARIVKEKSILRQLISAAGEISESAYSEQESVASILDHAENLIFKIAQGRDTQNFRHIREVLQDVYGHLQELRTNAEATQGTKTGFSLLDRVLAGMGKSDLVLIGARPGMGKTSFALNIATNVAKQTKKAVCIFSLEMSAEQLVNRVLASEALVNSGVNRHFIGVLDHPPAVDLVTFRHFFGGFLCLLIAPQGFLQIHARIFFLFLRTGEQHFALDANQLACHDDEIARQLHVQILRRFNVSEVLVTDQRDRNVGDIHFVFLNQREQEIQRSLEVELLQSVCDAFHVCTSEKIRLTD